MITVKYMKYKLKFLIKNLSKMVVIISHYIRPLYSDIFDFFQAGETLISMNLSQIL